MLPRLFFCVTKPDYGENYPHINYIPTSLQDTKFVV